MESQSAYTIGVATKDEYINYYNIQKSLGWDPIDKCQLLIEATDMNGSFFGKINGQIVSSISAMKYQKYGFIGVYWVKQECRGKGYGLQIFNKAMEYLKDCQLIGLDAVAAQVLTYQKSGFQSFCNSFKGYAVVGPQKYNPITTLIVTDKNEIDINQIGVFDKQYFPSDRTNFLKKAFELGEAIVSYDPINKKIQGYGVVNKKSNGVVLGPLVASTQFAAEDIIQSMFQKIKAEHYVLFYNDNHNDIVELIKKYFPTVDFTCRRMYHKTSSFKNYFNNQYIYGLSGFERG